MAEPTTEHDLNTFTWRVPPHIRLEQGERLAWWEWIEVLWVRPLARFRWRCRLTPALRERCVEYVVRLGRTTDTWGIRREAQQLAEYIARGER